MRKHQIENAAHEVATQVRAVEDSIEAALIELAELQTRMVHARSVTRAGFVDSHAAFEQLAAATSGLVAARGGIAHCHAALAEARKTIPGLRTVGFGDNECPPAEGVLRVVA
jgi:dGTP triphosphohydrolase